MRRYVFRQTIRQLFIIDRAVQLKARPFLSEGSVASGVRRIEASTGLETMKVLNHDLEELTKLAAMFRTSPADLRQKLEQQANELKEAKRLVEQYKAKEEFDFFKILEEPFFAVLFFGL